MAYERQWPGTSSTSYHPGTLFKIEPEPITFSWDLALALRIRPEDLLPRFIREGWVEVMQVLRKACCRHTSTSRKAGINRLPRSKEKLVEEEEV